jgi:hypothetical protein
VAVVGQLATASRVWCRDLPRGQRDTGTGPLPLRDVPDWEEIVEVSLTLSGAAYVTNVDMDVDDTLPDLPEDTTGAQIRALRI